MAAATRKTRRERLMPRAAWWGTCTALAVLFLYPLYVMLAQSLKAPKEAAETPLTLYPHALSTDNYSGLSHSGEGLNVFDHIGNSVMVSLGATGPRSSSARWAATRSPACASQAATSCSSRRSRRS
jgi:ABC-type glycerol-3-phosphate transport system permease component